MTATAVEQAEAAAAGTGRVARVIGPVVDIEFPADAMPDIYNALHDRGHPGRRTSAR